MEGSRDGEVTGWRIWRGDGLEDWDGQRFLCRLDLTLRYRVPYQPAPQLVKRLPARYHEPP
jgi:hypothetical protein